MLTFVSILILQYLLRNTNFNSIQINTEFNLPIRLTGYVVKENPHTWKKKIIMNRGK